MVSTSNKVRLLRQLLAERFGSPPSAVPESVYHTGVPVLDEIGIPQAALTEIVAAGPGGTLLLYGLLHTASTRNERVILVDGCDCFQPRELPESECRRLLWTRCRTAQEALRVVDLAARDGNFPLILFLLSLNRPAELKRISVGGWHRLQMLVEKSAVSLLVFTPFPQVGSARLRISVSRDFPLAQLHDSRSRLLSALQVRVERRRIERRDDETVRRPLCA